MAKILILGARKGSLGEAIRDRIPSFHFAETAGISGDEDRRLMPSMMLDDWDHVICTIGKNHGEYDDIFATNVALPMRYLKMWLVTRTNRSNRTPGSFVIISSNSAHVPRSGSGPYCASKAALSMAIECEARWVAGHRRHFGETFLYGYEPCWIEGTPMSQEVLARLPDDTPPHRVPGGVGLDKNDLANLIFSNLRHGKILHGRNLRVDLGDQ